MLEGSITYTYGRLPVDMSASVFRQITPATNYQLGSNTIPWIQETVGATTALGYSMPRAFDSQSFNLSYSFARIGGQLPAAGRRPQPVQHAEHPARAARSGRFTSGGATRTPRGTCGASARRTASASGRPSISPTRRSRATSRATPRPFGLATYFPMPWLRHHVLALHAGGGSAGDNRGGRGPFYVGGFIDLPIVNVVRNSLIQGGVELRGYPGGRRGGQLLRPLQRRVPVPDRERRPRARPRCRSSSTGSAARPSSTTAAPSPTPAPPSSRRAWAASSGST